MGRKKKKRFAENAIYTHVIEPQVEEIRSGTFALKGKWKQEIFGNDKPLVLELGCGKGEYSVAMARVHPDKNFLGIDIKGARIWYGATEAKEDGLNNIAFLRTQIDLIDKCFEAGEVDEIWITFPDPQIKNRRRKMRLTYPDFLEKYKHILQKGGVVHLKTDSEFLHGYTIGILHGFPGARVEKAYFDIDGQLSVHDPILHGVRTHYENLFREKGKTITYLKFKLHA